MIVVVGETLVDVVHDQHGTTTETPGGSPYNVAIGLGRLDVRTTLITQVGSDEHAAVVLEHAHASGVVVEAAPASGGRTPTATAVLDALGQATYAFDLEWSLGPRDLPPCDALHVGSLGTTLRPGRDTVLDLVDQAVRADRFTSYDPNLRASFVEDPNTAWSQTRELAARCTLVKLSDEDAALLRPGSEAPLTARLLLAGERTRLVVLTHGAAGATAFASRANRNSGAAGEDITVSASPRPTRLVDTVGAGDALMSALLAQLADDDAFADDGAGLPQDAKALGEVLAAAVEVAALTCERRGSDPPTRAQLPPTWPHPEPGQAPAAHAGR